jgi:hypothetical protein
MVLLLILPLELLLEFPINQLVQLLVLPLVVLPLALLPLALLPLALYRLVFPLALLVVFPLALLVVFPKDLVALLVHRQALEQLQGWPHNAAGQPLVLFQWLGPHQLD